MEQLKCFVATPETVFLPKRRHFLFDILPEAGLLESIRHYGATILISNGAIVQTSFL